MEALPLPSCAHHLPDSDNTGQLPSAPSLLSRIRAHGRRDVLRLFCWAAGQRSDSHPRPNGREGHGLFCVGEERGRWLLREGICTAGLARRCPYLPCNRVSMSSSLPACPSRLPGAVPARSSCSGPTSRPCQCSQTPAQPLCAQLCPAASPCVQGLKGSPHKP